MRDLSTWREIISRELENQGESWEDVISTTLSSKELDVEFDDGYGTAEGKPFTLWTTCSVYFPVEYDGSEACSSVSRVVDGKPTDHIG